MTKVQLSLPDELAKAAAAAGLLAPEAMQAMLREKLRTEGMAALERAWAKSGDVEPSVADEKLIAEAIRAARKAA
ncbi:MAG: hypothetical protein IPG54_13460 [Sphingomonadales bacterium]|jgi:hypothetical protein|nr:hypothetical protein [Sphingomonadales bacterium]MBK9004693.1 hypothetical protein [Sphingomonadales bacterium]MBK9269876.1 hypothetical protein [Sphingomonadales bacterium]MBP6433808.1 hypothetical protein [Sphingorhabdus sp.]